MAEIEFDPEDYIDEIATRHLIRELKKRKILPQNFNEFQSRIEPGPFLKTPKRAMLIDILKLPPLATLEDIQEAVKENYNK